MNGDRRPPVLASRRRSDPASAGARARTQDCFVSLAMTEPRAVSPARLEEDFVDRVADRITEAARPGREVSRGSDSRGHPETTAGAARP